MVLSTKRIELILAVFSKYFDKVTHFHAGQSHGNLRTHFTVDCKREGFGIPIGIYEKGQAFKDLYNPLKYDEADTSDKVRRIKEQLDKKIGNAQMIDILKKLQFNVEALGEGRIYVEFVDKKLSRMP